MNYQITKKIKTLELNVLNCFRLYKKISPLELSKLENYYYKEKPKFEQKVIKNIQYDLMIIIPVYNASKYLHQCIESLIHQNTKYSYCMIFVDDGSTDNSYNILKQYQDLENIIIKHKENEGISIARNLALKNILGRYIMFVDSDDYISKDCIEELMTVAIDGNYDLVEGSYKYFNNKGYIEGINHKDNIYASDGDFYGYPWGKIIKSKFFYNLIFPETFNFEDSIIKTLLIPVCNKKCTISKNVYNYRINDNSITHNLRGKKASLDSFYLMKYIIDEQKNRSIYTGIDGYVYFLNQIRLNYLRMIGLPKYIHKIVFYLTCDIFESLYKNYNLKNKSLIYIEKVLKNRNYVAYNLLMEEWLYFK